MAKVKTVAFDAAEFLDTEEAQAAYLQEAFATGDPAYIARSVGTVARARGMSAIARDAGVGRESLYKALSGEGNPEFGTIVKVLSALHLALSVKPLAVMEPSRHDVVCRDQASVAAARQGTKVQTSRGTVRSRHRRQQHVGA
jgi:probable addiction module antidote protein